MITKVRSHVDFTTTEQSASQDLLGNLDSLGILADGTPVVTGGRSYGKFFVTVAKWVTGNVFAFVKFPSRRKLWLG